MKKTSLLILIMAASFTFGFAVKAVISDHRSDMTNTGRATGIGGIFFKCKDPKKVREWYKTHLGLNTNEYGAVFEWY